MENILLSLGRCAMPRVNGGWLSKEKMDEERSWRKEVVLEGEKFKSTTEADGSRQCREESLEIKRGGRK